MAGLTLSSSILSSFYKMDNVLYEINDQQGILKNNNYELWKQEVISDLANSGFIQLVGDIYVLTEDGRNVIKHDSFLYYNRRINLQRVEPKQEEVHPEEREGIIKNISIGVGIVMLLAAIVTIAGMI